jgi:hypothetical protein
MTTMPSTISRPMENSRRRKDILFLMTLVGTGIVAADENPKFKTPVFMGVFRTFMAVVKLHEKVQPDKQKRAREQHHSKEVVNAVLLPTFANLKPEIQLWAACNVCMRLVASGWRPEPADVLNEFVQALYNLAQSFPVIDAPHTRTQELVSMSPETLRALGMFR